MAERRMFSKSIIDSDAFIAMPLSAQALYFHLAMRADDDGFVNSPNRIRRDVGAAEDDLSLLIAKRFALVFDSGVIVIKHWKIHNYIQKDRYKPTTFRKEMSLLMVCENGAYTDCIHDVSTVDTQVRLELGKSKDRGRLGKDSVVPQQLQQHSVYSASAREETAPPALLEVHRYMAEELCVESAASEAEKFIAWNALREWACLPNWQAAADLWCARIDER